MRANLRWPYRPLLWLAVLGGFIGLGGFPFFAGAADVALYRVFETSLTNGNAYADKFRDVTLNAVFTSPSEGQARFWGFYDGDGAGGQTGSVWKLRFMPWEAGVWTYQYTWSDGTPGGSGTFNCVTKGRGRGVLQPYALNPKWLAYNGTEPVMLNEYYVGGSARVDLPWTITNVYEQVRGAGVNAVMFLGAPATDKSWDQLPAFRWSDGPAPQPRYPEDFHLDAWKLLEGHVGWLNEHDMLAYLWSGFWDYDDFWVRYCCARLAPFANVAWDYRSGQPAPAWLLKAWMHYDPWNHPRGGQHHQGWANAPEDYTWLNVSTTWNTNPVAQAHAEVLRHWTAPRTIPVVWNEGPLWHNEYLTDQEQMRRLAWGAVTAAGYFCWNWTSPLPFNAGGNQDNYDPAQPRAAADILASDFDEYAQILARVMNEEVELGRLSPADSLLLSPTGNVFCLAEPDRQYLVYREGGGLVTLALPAGNYDSYWIDTKTGSKTPGARVAGTGAPVVFTAPNTTTDWVLIIKAPLRILALGDSITQGNKDNQSYRYQLWKKLVSANVNMDFVGSMRTADGTDPVWPDFNGKAFDRDHEGHWGWRVDQILGILGARLTLYMPDVVLLHLGHNDLNQGQDVAQTAEELRQVIAVLRARNPVIKVLLAKLIPTLFAFNTGIIELNRKIEELAATESTPASPVRLVDQFSGFNPTNNTIDGVHPNTVGEEKMAQRWFDALVRYDPPDEQVVLTGSPGGSVYAAPLEVTLNSLTMGAAIRYTTNGTIPSRTNGILYDGPILLNTSATVKAIGYKAGAMDSEALSSDFTLVHSGALRRGINLGGPAVTIDGNTWLSDADARAAGFSSVDTMSTTTNYSFPVLPIPSTNEMTMLQSLVYRSGTGAFTLKQTITDGTYHVYVWLIENYESDSRAIDVDLEGIVAATNIGRLSQGAWSKYGPYITQVSDGELTVRVSPNNSQDPLLCGLAIFDSEPAVGRFLTPAVKDGQITLDWTGDGKLATAPYVEGPWTTLTQAVSRPHSEPIALPGSRFYRLIPNP